ncbi:MAG TPA: hypothetical protein VL860_00600 [Planctomycetota bacterium]|nr:hypothetical protein [Planctomycetota bacterium]
MRSLRTAIFWITGILLWVFALSIGLAWIDFGYLDVRTVVTMGLMLLPLLGVAIGALIWTRAQEKNEEQNLTETKEIELPRSHGKASAIRAAIRPPVADFKQTTATSSASRNLEPVEKGDHK